MFTRPLLLAALIMTLSAVAGGLLVAGWFGVVDRIAVALMTPVLYSTPFLWLGLIWWACKRHPVESRQLGVLGSCVWVSASLALAFLVQGYYAVAGLYALGVTGLLFTARYGCFTRSCHVS